MLNISPSVLTPYLQKVKVRKEKNLVSGEDMEVIEEVSWMIVFRFAMKH